MSCYTAAEECTGNYTLDFGTIDYPLGNSTYGNNESCEWNVQLPNFGNRIFVNVTELEIESCPNCRCDALEVSIYMIVYCIILWLSDSRNTVI